MLEKSFYNLKDNLIKLGLKDNDFSNLEKYLIKKEGEIIFPDVFLKRFNLDYETTKEILLFLSKEKVLSIMYRLKVDQYYWDYDILSDIPKEIEVNDKIIEDVLERVYILFKVKSNE